MTFPRSRTAFVTSGVTTVGRVEKEEIKPDLNSLRFYEECVLCERFFPTG